jgi:hypothetical protein
LPRSAKSRHDRSHSLIREADRLLNSLLFARTGFGHFVGFRRFVSDEAAQSLLGQSLLVFQVAIGDQLALGVLAKPALTMPQEFFHFRITNPIMLIVVEDRDEHIEMRQQITQANGALEPNGVVGTLTPLRKFLVERVPGCCYFVTQNKRRNRFSPPRQGSTEISASNARGVSASS